MISRWTILSVLVAVAFRLVLPAAGEAPPSPHFTLHRLADGVYAVINTPGGLAVSNAGIIDLGGAVLVFDTLMGRPATLDLIRAAQALGSGPIRYLANSHAHKDHCWGNQLFPEGTAIISTEETRQVIRREVPRDDPIELQKTLTDRIDQVDEKLPKAASDHAREELLLTRGYYQALRETYPQLRITPPGLTLEHRLTIHGAKRSAQLISFGKGSTGSDLLLYLPAEKILFAGDQVFIGMHPFLTESSVPDWVDGLRKMQQLEVATLVPGHGPLGDAGDIRQMIRYLDSVNQMVQELARDGKTPATLSVADVPDPFAGWFYPGIYLQNVTHVFQKRGDPVPKP